MDDLKVVLYIVIAIIWVVYNNYKKISDASQKRDYSKPPAEVIQENWPGKKEKPIVREIQIPREVVDKQIKREMRPVLERKPLPQRNPIRKPNLTSRQRLAEPAIYRSEGGPTTPSKVVQVEEQVVIYEEPNPLITAIRNMDLRQGILIAEVLKRPYN